METTWNSSSERFVWIEKKSAIYLCVNVLLKETSGHIIGSNVTLYGVQTKGTTIILYETKLHLLEYMAMQMEDLDDECL